LKGRKFFFLLYYLGNSMEKEAKFDFQISNISSQVQSKYSGDLNWLFEEIDEKPGLPTGIYNLYENRGVIIASFNPDLIPPLEVRKYLAGLGIQTVSFAEHQETLSEKLESFLLFPFALLIVLVVKLENWIKSRYGRV
jgi:hypothetical protein